MKLRLNKLSLMQVYLHLSVVSTHRLYKCVGQFQSIGAKTLPKWWQNRPSDWTLRILLQKQQVHDCIMS